MTEVQPVAPSLVVTAPDTMRGQGFVLTSEKLTIGRGVENDVRIEDPHVSRRHAVVRWANDVVTIEDAESSAGLLVNNARVTQPHVLRAGDRIRIGPVELELKGGPRPGPAGSPDGSGTARRAPAPGRRGARPGAGPLMAGGFAFLLAGATVAAVSYARWVSPILACVNRAQQVAAPATSCIDSTGLVIAGIGGLIAASGIIMVIVAMVVKRGARRESARL